MLEAVHTIHEERVVHGDLKPANFVCIQGRLKLIDFGIAKAISNDTTNIVRDNQVRSCFVFFVFFVSFAYQMCLADVNSQLHLARGAHRHIVRPKHKVQGALTRPLVFF